MKQKYLTTILLTMLISMTGAKAFAYDIEVANADGVTIYYNYINNKTELAVTSRNHNAVSTYTGSVVIPETVVYNGSTYSVTLIGEGAFCFSDLTSVTIPNSVTMIGPSAFSVCCRLTSITIPNSVTKICSYAFAVCQVLTSVTIPNSVTEIGEHAFSDCWDLTSVTIPNSVTKIEPSTFSGCIGMTSVTIPNSVTKIGDRAFWGCFGLTSVTIPNSVTEIDDYAFRDCSALTSVTIPNSVTKIGTLVFDGCRSLTTLYFLNTTPPNIGTDYFTNDQYQTLNVFVPQEALEAYQNAGAWKNFRNLQGFNRGTATN